MYVIILCINANAGVGIPEADAADPVLKHMVHEEDAIFNDPTLRDMVMEKMHEQVASTVNHFSVVYIRLITCLSNLETMKSIGCHFAGSRPTTRTTQ